MDYRERSEHMDYREAQEFRRRVLRRYESIQCNRSPFLATSKFHENEHSFLVTSSKFHENEHQCISHIAMIPMHLTDSYDYESLVQQK
jgi:hypothetical protein